jgi:FMN phosphatase YigB (HAD superfamily)
VVFDGAVELDVLSGACSAARLEHEQAWRENRQFLLRDATESMLRALDDHCRDDAALRDRLADAYETATQGAAIPLLPGVADAVRGLDDAGVSIGIVCDVGLAPSAVLVANLEHHGLLGCFTHWSFSDAVGVYKPDPRIFEHALQGLGVDDPADAWHIGDLRRTDVAGARACGMGTVRAAIVHDDHPDEGPEADAVITDYAQLPDVLGLA